MRKSMSRNTFWGSLTSLFPDNACMWCAVDLVALQAFTLDLQQWWQWHDFLPTEAPSLEALSGRIRGLHGLHAICNLKIHASMRRSPATLQEESAPARSEVNGAAVSDGCVDAGLLPPEQSELSMKEVPTCESDMLLAPLSCAPISIPHAKPAWVGSLPPGSPENPAGLRVWTPAVDRGERRPDVLHATSQASTASGSTETPAGVRVGTPAWSAWRRRRDLLRASSQASAASGAESPAGPAEGTPAWRVNHHLGCAAGAPDNANQHDLNGAAQLAAAGTLKRAHSEADALPAAPAQVAGMSQSHAETATQRSHGDSGMSVSPTRPRSCSWHPV